MVNSCTETIINGLMIIGMLIGFFQIRHLDFLQSPGPGPAPPLPPGRAVKHDTDTIMTVTSFGMFVYSTFTIIAGVLTQRSNLYEPGELIVTNGIIELIEVNVKGMYIIFSVHRYFQSHSLLNFWTSFWGYLDTFNFSLYK